MAIRDLWLLDGYLSSKGPKLNLHDNDYCNYLTMQKSAMGADNEAETSEPLAGQNSTNSCDSNPNLWSPSGVWWKDFFYFVGPGWFVSIAYVDPGNYQADIQAGALSKYSLLCIIWWTSILSIYVQVLCVRLSFYSGLTLAEVQARHSRNDKMRYLSWFLAEFSTVITDLPTVIGIGIACNIFFGWPYYVGVLMSMITTMIFLATLSLGHRLLEVIVMLFVAIMSIALFIEMDFVGTHGLQLIEGWTVGFKDLTNDDIFSITGVVGAVVMPHNLYLHSAACQSRKFAKEHVEEAVYWSSIEPILPILVSFFINLAVVSISAERVFGTDGAAFVGLTDFCSYFEKLKNGCLLWGVALIAAGQSSAITTTYTGQYVMDGFLNIQLSVRMRAVITRMVAITPCVLVSVLFPNHLNQMVNMVNAALSFLLPFAFTPLVKYNCSEGVLGKHASKGLEKCVLYFFAIAVWLINAVGLSIPGGGFFGDLRPTIDNTFAKILLTTIEILIQFFYLWYNASTLITSVTEVDQTALELEMGEGEDENFEIKDQELL